MSEIVQELCQLIKFRLKCGFAMCWLPVSFRRSCRDDAIDWSALHSKLAGQWSEEKNRGTNVFHRYALQSPQRCHLATNGRRIGPLCGRPGPETTLLSEEYVVHTMCFGAVSRLQVEIAQSRLVAEAWDKPSEN